MDDSKKRVRIGGLWQNPAGTVISGTWGGNRIVIFPNKEKRGDKSPDFTMYLEELPPKDGAKGGEKGGW